MKSFYFNNMIVSVKLFYQKHNESFVYTNEYRYYTMILGREKVRKFKDYVWLYMPESFYGDFVYKTDEDIIKRFNRLDYNRTCSIIDHKLYMDPMVQITYANNKSAYKSFKTNEEAEEFYKSIIANNKGIEFDE